MSIKVVFFDIDGTLASHSIKSDKLIDKVPESSKIAIQKLKDNHIIPIIATGRGRYIIQPLVKALGIDTYIASNGLSLTYCGEEISKSFLRDEQVKEILKQIYGKIDATILLETTEGLVLIQQSTKKEYKSYIHNKVLDNHSLTNKYHIYQVIVDGEDVAQHVDIQIPGLKARMVSKNGMDIYPRDMSKAVGVHTMLEKLSLSIEEAMAFGDEENDIEMLQCVKNSVVMGNGNPKVKQIASYITDDVDHDGIYNACLHFGLFDMK